MTKTEKARAKAINSDSTLLHYVTRVVVCLVALGAAVLSFDALTALALAAGIRIEFAWIWAVVIDGFIMVATFAAFALKERGKSKYYAWTTLGIFVLFSIMGNAWHAAIAKESFELPIEIAVIVTAIPPLALFLAIHLLVIMVSPTHEQKLEHERQVKKTERLRAIEEKELEKIEREARIREVREQGAKVLQTPISAPAPLTIKEQPLTTPQEVKLQTTKIAEVENSSELKTETEIINLVSEKYHSGESLPTGKAIAAWLGKSERTGQNLLKKIKTELETGPTT